jgi:transaldolase
MIEFMLDTANIAAISRFVDVFPIAGVTSNPSILKSEGKIDFFPHMKKIREIIGIDRSLHIQVIAEDFQGIIREAETILRKIDEAVAKLKFCNSNLLKMHVSSDFSPQALA